MVDQKLFGRRILSKKNIFLGWKGKVKGVKLKNWSKTEGEKYISGVFPG